MWKPLFCTSLAVLATGCTNAGGKVAMSPAGVVAAEVPAAQRQRALAIFDEYRTYGRVDDELRWAPFLCRQPQPGIARASASRDQGTHGQKLYSVFARDHAGYPANSKVGQVVVKESFTAEPVDAQFRPNPSEWSAGSAAADHFYPYATKDGQTFRAGQPAGLFLMYRVAADDPAADAGWIYATVSPMREVTASGRIASCMSCHEEAPHGRLFGVSVSPGQ